MINNNLNYALIAAVVDRSGFYWFGTRYPMDTNKIVYSALQPVQIVRSRMRQLSIRSALLERGWA